MLKTLTKTALTAAGLVLAATGANAASLHSAQLNLNSLGTLTAIAEDGQSYSKLESDNLQFFGDVKITMGTGKVNMYAVYHGACGGLCGTGFGFKRLFLKNVEPDKASVNENVSFAVSADDFPQGLSQNTEAVKIFQACHAKMRGAVMKTDTTITHFMKVSLAVQYVQATFPWPGSFDGAPGGIDPDWVDDFTVPVTVVCKALDDRTGPGGIVNDHGDYRSKSVDLDVKTYPNDTHQPTPGITCPVVHVTTRVTANQVGLAGADRIAQIDGGAPETANLLIGTAFHPEDGSYAGEQTQKYYLGPNTHARFYARIQSGGVVMSTPWKDVTVKCKGPGSGLTTQTDEPQAPARTLKGDFTFVDHGAPKCTREGKALISFTSNQPGDVHYTLDCTNGQNFSGVATLVKNPSGGYVAAAMKSFDIATSTVYSCALKTSAPGAARLHQWKSHDYKCETPAVIPPVGGLQTAPKPDQEARDDAARAKAVEDARARQQAEAERQRRDALQARLKAAQDAAEAQRRREAAIAAQRAKAALEQQRINALKLQQAAPQRRTSAPVQAVPQLRVQRPVLRRR